MDKSPAGSTFLDELEGAVESIHERCKNFSKRLTDLNVALFGQDPKTPGTDEKESPSGRLYKVKHIVNLAMSEQDEIGTLISDLESRFI